METHGEVNHRPGAIPQPAAKSSCRPVGFSAATTVEFTAAANSAHPRLIWNDLSSSLIFMIWRRASVSLPAYERSTVGRARCPGAPQAPPAGREALDAGAAPSYVSGPGTDREGDGYSRALRRRVTPISGGYRGRPRQCCQRRPKIRQYRRLKIRQIGEGTSLSLSRPPDAPVGGGQPPARAPGWREAPARARCADACDSCCREWSRGGNDA